MLHQIFHKATVRVLLLLVASTTLFSFANIKGRDFFEVYINNKRVIQQYVNMDPKDVKTFAIDKSSLNDKIRVMYSHCGEVGKSRVITIKDDKNKALKNFKFANAEAVSKTMDCNAKEILGLVKDNQHAKLNLVYTSEEIPEGKLLASIMVTNSATNITKLK